MPATSQGTKFEIKVGQIFLTHPRDDNFTSVYEESFQKQGTTLYLFAVIDIPTTGKITADGRLECEKLARVIVTTLKKVYVAAPVPDEMVFEKALAAINSAIARAASKEQISFLSHLNAAIGVVSGNFLSLSVAGNSIVYLARRNELTLLSKGLAPESLKPTKLFANFASGKLASWDRVLLSNRQLLNYLSLERLGEFLSDANLDNACTDIIETVTDVKDTGFSAYLFEISVPGKTPPAKSHRFLPAVLQMPQRQDAPLTSREFLSVGWAVAARVGNWVLDLVTASTKISVNFLQRVLPEKYGRRLHTKRYMAIAIALVLVIFFGNLTWAKWRNSREAARQSETTAITALDQKISEAESALLYNNQNRAMTFLPEIEALLSALDEDDEHRPSFEERFATLKDKINKELRADNPTVLTTFEIVPTDLLRSPNGFLAFNKNTGRLAFYDFRTAATRKILQNTNTGNLGFGMYLGPLNGYIFIDKDGRWQKLNLDADTLTPIEATIPSIPSPSDLGRARSTAILGEDANARIYVIDAKNQQIWRLDVNDSGITAPSAWLKTSADFTNSRDLGLDSSVYALYPDGLVKYAAGVRQNFNLPPVQPAPQNLTGLVVSPETSFIYLLDPDNSRILQLTKSGALERQIISPKFRELSDIYVDEQAGLLYAIAGSELLQVNLK